MSFSFHAPISDAYSARLEEKDAWNRSELEQAMSESLEVYSKHNGRALAPQQIKEMGFYFESQAPGSDTCGLNALNNLCQRRWFETEELQKAEAQCVQAQDGGSFAPVPPIDEMPNGFFDVEALKVAASAKDLEIVDVEPVPDFRSSRCFAFAEAAAAHGDGSWLLGFLVYDRQPGQMHYYALRRYENSGSWLKLDSQLPPDGREHRNRLMKEEDIWAIYADSKPQFQAWLLRWYPVVYRPGAAREVCKALEGQGYKLSKVRAARVLAETGWIVTAAVRRLLYMLPQAATRELLVRFARPSEAEMRGLLDAAGWDLSAAQPAIDRVLRQRIALAKEVDSGERTRQALSLCDWDPVRAATLLALQLQLGSDVKQLPELQEALNLAGGSEDRAEAVMKLQPAVSNAQSAVRLLEQCSWSVQTAKRVLDVHKRFARVSVQVALELLRRNDDDPHAACEMLVEYHQRIQRIVREQVDGMDVVHGEESAIADTALNATDWDPRSSFLAARNLSQAVKSTRQLARQRGYDNFTVDSVLAALTAAEMKPKLAVAVLFGELAVPRDPAQRAKDPALVSAAFTAAPAVKGESADEDYCCLM